MEAWYDEPDISGLVGFMGNVDDHSDPDDELDNNSADSRSVAPASKKRKVAKKDPKKPKGPKSAYICYTSAKRESVAADMPDASFGDINRELGRRWKMLSPEEKKPFLQMAEADQERHKGEMAGYKPEFDSKAAAAAAAAATAVKRTPAQSQSSKKGKKEEKKKKKKKDPNAPKKPLSAYFLFQANKRDEVKAANPELTIGEVSKHVGAAWKALSEAERMPYLARADEEKIKYQEAKAKYEASL